jgi:LacI family transcriptional regulator
LVFVPIDKSGSWEEIVLGGQIDGGVVFHTLSAEVRESLRERQLPLVLLGDTSDPTVSKVVVEDVVGAYVATKHLLGLGHNRILLFVHKNVKPSCSVQERLAGYRSAMAEAGLVAHECMQSPEEDAIDVLVRGQDRPTAVICFSDLEATLLVHAMWQYSVNIPRDLSIVGFNDVFATRFMTPPLTTVSYDASKIGELGSQLVLQEINASGKGRKISVLTVKPKLYVRGSTGPAPPRERSSIAWSIERGTLFERSTGIN